MANRVTPITRTVLPGHTPRDELEQATATVDIAIPAFNEGSCIDGLLNDVIMARQGNWF